MNNERIILHPCGFFEKELLDILIADIGTNFRREVALSSCTLDISGFYNPGRRQYDANQIMKSIGDFASPVDKIIGLMRVDIYVPILTFIFGQAELGGRTGLASLYRLRNELYGMDINNKLMTERFRKVVLHEAGHLFGLIHCHRPDCVMRSSTYVEDIDQKGKGFCISCREELDKLLDNHT